MNMFDPVMADINKHSKAIEEAESFQEWHESKVNEIADQILTPEGYRKYCTPTSFSTYSIGDVTQVLYEDDLEAEKYEQLLLAVMNPKSDDYEENMARLRNTIRAAAKVVAEMEIIDSIVSEIGDYED